MASPESGGSSTAENPDAEARIEYLAALYSRPFPAAYEQTFPRKRILTTSLNMRRNLLH
jgi:hypothetical protein